MKSTRLILGTKSIRNQPFVASQNRWSSGLRSWASGMRTISMSASFVCARPRAGAPMIPEGPGRGSVLPWPREGLPVTDPLRASPELEPLTHYREYPPDEMRRRAAEFHAEIRRRRTVRDFSPRPVPREVIEQAVLAAGTAPSGANMQPWHFAVVADPERKRRIRAGAEEEERAFYHGGAPQAWLDALAPLGTDEHKPFLEVAPYLVVVFAQSYGVLPDGRKVKNYYVTESVGIAVGLLVAALHHAGLVTLTHTPSPMRFLNDILGRPPNERPYLVLVVGYPAEGARVPVAGGRKKALADIATFT